MLLWPMTEEAREAEADLQDLISKLGTPGRTASDQHRHVLEQLMKADWKGAGVLEYADYLLFPDELIRRKADGSWDRIPVMLRIPREADMRAGRRDARAWAKRESIDEKEDRDLFVNLENMCILAGAIRNNTPPHEAWEPDPQILDKRYDKVCIKRMWNRLDHLLLIIDPEPHELSGAEIIALTAAIHRSRSLGPLVAYAQVAQTSCVVGMADLLMSFLESKYSSESIARSTRDFSRPNTSVL